MSKRIQIERMKAVVGFFDYNPARVARAYYNAGYRHISDVIEAMTAAGVEQNKIQSIVDRLGIDLSHIIDGVNEND